jgi:hypothetical protein
VTEKTIAAAKKLDNMQAVVATALAGYEAYLNYATQSLVRRLEKEKDSWGVEQYEKWFKAIEVASKLKLPQKL